jgi:UDP:flavonoid glycosyltransferase YjiC (YdhE family)
LRRAVNQARQKVLGLPPLPFLGPPPRMFRDQPALYGFSPRVLPRPRDWNANQVITGYWFLESPGSWQPSAALAEFLGAGPPPVVVGFGSMHDPHAGELTGRVIEALTRARLRGVLLTGWGGLSNKVRSDAIYVAESVPHDWLFPRAAAVVHHGGAGTTAAALRAGVPSIVVPFMADQPFWGSRIARLGVGPRPIPRRRMSALRLANALCAATLDPEMRRRASELGEQIRAEDGVGGAVEVFHAYAKTLVPERSDLAPWTGRRIPAYRFALASAGAKR